MRPKSDDLIVVAVVVTYCMIHISIATARTALRWSLPGIAYRVMRHSIVSTIQRVDEALGGSYE